MAKFVTIEDRSGAPITTGSRTIVPVTHLVHVRLPGFPGGLVWNRPAAVLSITPGGYQQEIKVPDVTRQAQIALLAASLLFMLILGSLTRRSKEIKK